MAELCEGCGEYVKDCLCDLAGQGEEAPLALNPWHPMSDPVDLKHLGKLGEELNEAGAATARCIIQGIGESEPVTGKPNKEWLEDELADVYANAELCIQRFGLDRERMAKRITKKILHLSSWHEMA